MNRKLILAAAMLAFTVPAKAQVVLDLSLITCQQFMDAPPEDQAMISSWLSGYHMGSKNLTTIDMRYVKRNYEVGAKYCKSHKDETLMSVIDKTAK